MQALVPGTYCRGVEVNYDVIRGSVQSPTRRGMYVCVYVYSYVCMYICREQGEAHREITEAGAVHATAATQGT